ncbi:MAG: carbon monoxide dehydrogenase [Acetobacteraceae bacterium]|nr:carbon monoxide dehydrogenase [Acetobacteraceae bacterium]
MDMSGERRIQAPRQKVWDALNDPEALKASIPGCESMKRLGENELQATVAMKIGPISARFSGKVSMSEIDPPNGYMISGEGQGGVAGFAKGGAAVRLNDAEGGTVLTYVVKAQVGGKIAQLGARLIDASAKQMAEAFFDRFTARLAPVAEVVPAVRASVVMAPAEDDPHMRNTPVTPVPRSVGIFDLIPPRPYGIPIIGWGGMGVGVVVFLILAGSFFK